MQNIDFKFDIDCHYSSTVTIDVEEKHYEFHPTSMGENPLNLLIKGLYSLETEDYEPEEGVFLPHRMLWQGEPEGQTIALTKNGNDLHIEISQFSDAETYDHRNFVLLEWTPIIDVHTNYKRFKKMICDEALRLLQKFGIVGYVRSWGVNNEEFPLSKLLYLLDIKHIEELDLCFSSFSDELSSLSSKDKTATTIHTITLRPDSNNALFWDEDWNLIGDYNTLKLYCEEPNETCIDLSSIEELKEWYLSWHKQMGNQDTDQETMNEWCKQGVALSKQIKSLLPDNFYLLFISTLTGDKFLFKEGEVQEIGWI